MFRTLFISFIIFSASTVATAAPSVSICSDSAFWYPFTFKNDSEVTGLHIDIIRKALKNSGISAEFKALPWKRCLKEVENGTIDAVAVASYKDKRAEFMRYPSDAKTNKKSDFRVSQVEYVVITPAGSDYQFAGDVTTIPEPVRAPRGYSIADDLTKKGLSVDSGASGDENNLKKLLRDNDGSLVSIPEVMRKLAKSPTYEGKFKISEVPVKSKSYFLPFSKKSKLNDQQVQKIWDEIAKVRDDEALVAEFAAKY